MLDEKGLLDEVLEFTVDGEFHHMPVMVVVEFVEGMPVDIRNKVNGQLSKIDFMNGNVMDFVEYLAKGIVK